MRLLWCLSVLAVTAWIGGPPGAAALTVGFMDTVTGWLDSEAIPWRVSEAFPAIRHVLEVGVAPQGTFLLHVVPPPFGSGTEGPPPDPMEYRTMTDASVSMKRTLVHLHQDVWASRPTIVRSRLRAQAGREARRLFARKTQVRRITGDVARPFFEAHHLWGATKAKYAYGLWFPKDDDGDGPAELVAAASFSAGRTILRRGVPHRSHELLRFCAARDTRVVGGLSRLLVAFLRDQRPDDVVTQIDRDWGGAADALRRCGFVGLGIRPPLVMAVGRADGVRRHLIGAGIVHLARTQAPASATSSSRLGLPPEVLADLAATPAGAPAATALDGLVRHGFAPVYDSGTERLGLLVPGAQAAEELARRYPAEVAAAAAGGGTDAWMRDLWEVSAPRCPPVYYSENPGIALLLEHARTI